MPRLLRELMSNITLLRSEFRSGHRKLSEPYKGFGIFRCFITSQAAQQQETEHTIANDLPSPYCSTRPTVLATRSLHSVQISSFVVRNKRSQQTKCRGPSPVLGFVRHQSADSTCSGFVTQNRFCSQIVNATTVMRAFGIV